MDHNEAVRRLKHSLIRQADHARESAVELETLVPVLHSDVARQIAEIQVKASHKLAKELRQLIEQVRET